MRARRDRSEFTAASLVVVLPLVAAGWTALGADGPAASGSPTPTSSRGYVADALCADCHEGIAATYAEVGMARSFYRPGDAPRIEDFEHAQFVHEASGRHYEMAWRDGELVCRRWQVDSRGRTFNVLEQRVDQVMGSGNHARVYLYRTEGGELYELPIAWYEQSKHWGMAPGYDRPDHHGFVRLVTRECMACHDAYPDVAAESVHFGRREVFPRELPEGIGCQRCHGPGAEHVRIASDPTAADAAIRSSIVNPEDLEPALREDVCLQCHLQPEALRASFLVRLGHDEYDFRPGMHLGEQLVHVDYDNASDGAAGGESDRFEINHHPYRLRQSKCFRASGGALSCLTCHDPHRVRRGEEAVAWYRSRCLTCHAVDDCSLEGMGTGDLAEPDCVSCHMPARRPADVVQVVMTDHRIVRGPVEPPGAPQPETDPSTIEAQPEIYAPSGLLTDAEEALYLDLARVENGSFDVGERLLDEAGAVKGDDLRPRFFAGVALLEQGRLGAASKVLQEICGADPDHELASVSLASARLRAGAVDEAVAVLEACLERDPKSASAHLLLAEALGHAGELERALAEVEQAARWRPLHAETQFTRGNLCARAGRRDEAIEAFRLAWAIDPRFEAPCTRLALSLEKADRDAEALEVLEQGAETFPDSVELASRLALLYLTAADPALRDVEQAIDQAERAHRLEAGNPFATLTLALALLRGGESTRAMGLATLARRQGADPASCLLIEALAERASGRDERARSFWEEARGALGDPGPWARHRAALLDEAQRVF